MKWSNVKARDLQRLVTKLGLEQRKSRGPHPTYWYFVDGKKQFTVKLPNIHGGSGSVTPGFLQGIRNQLQLTSSQFADLVECPLSAEEYERIVRNRPDTK